MIIQLHSYQNLLSSHLLMIHEGLIMVVVLLIFNNNAIQLVNDLEILKSDDLPILNKLL